MRKLRILLAPFLACAIAAVALAQSGGGYDLSWATIANGGGTAAGGNYNLRGTIGQHGVGGPQPQGNKFSVDSGFDGPREVPPLTSTPTPTRTATRTPTPTPRGPTATPTRTPTRTPTPRPGQSRTYLPLVVK